MTVRPSPTLAAAAQLTALPCPAGLQPTQEDQQLIQNGIQAARSAAEATIAEQQSLLQRLEEELQAQDIKHVRQACCPAC